ncbi:trigger factor [Sulfurimonas sp. SAG-AH-194-L11]|nr:trigger factor [Sulfurimonas sp. SAG-AH-194-L11]MDF1876675.1 trigger factor [Sulfurimonas sp. SAG-AH-194-L11]
MKVTVEKTDDINFILSGTVENSLIKEKVEKLKAKIAKEKKTDETPSDDTIEQDAAGEVFKDFIAAGIKEANIPVDSILGQPGLKKYEQREDTVYFEVELSTSPEINADIDYKDIVPEFTKPVASPEDIEKKLIEFATKQAPFKTIPTPKAVENGDVTVIDFEGFIDGKPFEGGSAEKFNLKIGSDSFIPGFEEQLIGMEYGETKDVILIFPDDYQADDLAGKESKFVVTLHEIQEQIPETPDDAFAKKILSDEKATIETLKEKLADQITSEELSQIYMSELKPKIIKALLAKFDFTLPNNIVEQEIDAKVREKTRAYSQEQHKEFMEDKGKFMELRESVREEARDSIKTALIVEALAKREGVIVQDQEVHAAIGYQAMMGGQDAQELLKYYEENNLMNSAKLGLTEDKLFGIMLGFNK